MLHTCRMAQVDLYTCFPIAAQAAAREFGLNSTDGRKMTLIGGLMYLSSQCICIGSLSVPLCVSLCTSVRLCVTHRLAGAGTTAGLVRTQRCIRWRQWCQSCAGQQVPTVRLFLCVSLCLSVSLCVSWSAWCSATCVDSRNTFKAIDCGMGTMNRSIKQRPH
jgi:hypothetical protein